MVDTRALLRRVEQRRMVEQTVDGSRSTRARAGSGLCGDDESVVKHVRQHMDEVFVRQRMDEQSVDLLVRMVDHELIVVLRVIAVTHVQLRMAVQILDIPGLMGFMEETVVPEVVTETRGRQRIVELIADSPVPWVLEEPLEVVAAPVESIQKRIGANHGHSSSDGRRGHHQRGCGRAPGDGHADLRRLAPAGGPPRT